MKCIKSKTTGEIKRVKEEVAYELEKRGWGYVPKSEWKSTIRPQKAETAVVEKTVNKEGKPRRNREKKLKK